MVTEQQPDINYENAARQHYEFYAPALVGSTWWRLFAVGLAFAVILLGAGYARLYKKLDKQKVIVLKANTDGSFDRVEYVNMGKWLPSQKSIEHFAYVWAADYYNRVRATIATDYTDGLKFFSPEQRQQRKLEEEQTQWVEDFQRGSDPHSDP
jgi:hypothetical protein